MKLQVNDWERGPVDDMAADGSSASSAGIQDLLSTDTNDESEIPDTDDDTTDEEIKLDAADIEDDADEDTESKDSEEEVEKDDAEEDEDLADILSPFSKKKFESKYPGALKEFPQLERAINANTKYREVFPTVNDALEAQNSLERFGEIEKDLLSGSSKGFLTALKETDSKAFSNVVDNYFSNLRDVDEGAYFHILGNNVKDMIVAMANEAERAKSDDLFTAAKILNEFTFGTSEFAPKAKFSKAENPEENELKTQKEKFAAERLDTYQGELSDRVERQISKKIDDFIDIKDEMAPYVKKTATREANELVAKAIDGDKEFRRVLDKLWERARKDDYSQESLGNIRRAYVSKANTYLPQVIKKVRAQALGRGNGSSKNAAVDRKGPLARGNSATPNKVGKSSKSSEIPPGMSVKDFLLKD